MQQVTAPVAGCILVFQEPVGQGWSSTNDTRRPKASSKQERNIIINNGKHSKEKYIIWLTRING